VSFDKEMVERNLVSNSHEKQSLGKKEETLMIEIR
jgi:hypothetical protein